MEFPVRTGNPAKVESACLVIPVFKEGDLLPTASRLDDASFSTAATSTPGWGTCS